MAKPPTSAGQMRARVRFDKRPAIDDDGTGNTEGDWSPQFARWAEVKPMKGGEAVIASRLQGTQPVLIIVRMDSATKTITTDWRAVEILPKGGGERPYNIRSAEDMERDNRFVTILAEGGVAHG